MIVTLDQLVSVARTFSPGSRSAVVTVDAARAVIVSPRVTRLSLGERWAISIRGNWRMPWLIQDSCTSPAAEVIFPEGFS